MGRDKGRGRGGGGGRGSGRRLDVANEEEMAMRDRELDERREQRAKRRGEDEDEDEGEKKLGAVDEEEDDDEEEEGEGVKKAPIKTNNPNFSKPAATDSEDPLGGLSRKQKEVLEEQRKKDEYMKRHLALQTEEARRDMERLAMVRRRREEAAKQREVEGRPAGMSANGLPSDDEDDDDDEDSDDEDEAPKKPAAVAKPAAAPALSELQAKKRAAAIETAPTTSGEAGPPKLNAMDIKKLNGDALKDALKERGLDTQGQKKDLIKRLTDYEKARE